MWNLSYHAKMGCNTGVIHWYQTASIRHLKFQFNVFWSKFNNYLQAFWTEIYIVDRKLVLEKNFIKLFVRQPIIVYSYSSYILHVFSRLSMVYKLWWVILAINLKSPKDITEGILSSLFGQYRRRLFYSK